MTNLYPPRNALLLASAVIVLAQIPGCGSSWFAADDSKPPAIKPEDFVGPPQQADAQDEAPTTLVATDVAEPTQTSEPTRDREQQNDALAVNAMVGHINGEAVYADQIFDINVVAQLESFGQRFDGEAFLQQAAPVIQERLRGVIINKLILGEAERNLTDIQGRGIDMRVQQERDELIRFFGEGSLAVTKARFREERGRELEEHLAAFREELSIGLYIRSKVLPKIVVNQRDIERYYEDHKAEYQLPNRRSFRIIKVKDLADAQAVTQRLDRSEAFKDIAADAALNLYNPAGAGLFNNGELLAGDSVYGIKPVNDALIELKKGGHAGPIVAGEHQYFVELIDFEPGVTVPLSEAQLNIEDKLRGLQFEKHSLRFRMDLLQRGSYTDAAEMSQKLLEIAYARYDR